MPVDFFEKELATVCERYNQTFGKQSICNLKTRYQVIFAIIHMGMLRKKISKTGDKSMIRDDIGLFIRTKNTLMTIFSNAEKVWQERRCYDNGNQTDRQTIRSKKQCRVKRLNYARSAKTNTYSSGSNRARITMILDLDIARFADL